MSTRRIVVISAVCAFVIAGSLAAVALLADDDGAQPRPPDSTSPTTTGPPSPAEPPAPPVQTPPPAPATPSRPIPPDPAPAPVPPPPQAAPDPTGYRPAIVTPRPGMDNVRRISWRRAEVRNQRTVRVHYESGIAPCSVLDRVEVQYGAAITITLFEGSDPEFKDAVCIMIAQFKAVDVALNEPVGGRAIVDGST